MMVTRLVMVLTALGVSLAASEGRLRWRAPAGALTPELRQELAEHKSLLVAWLAAMATHWPATSLNAERRFGQPHARLFPLIGCPVMTPDGAAVLIQVFQTRAAVLFAAETGGETSTRGSRARTLVFLDPSLVVPMPASDRERADAWYERQAHDAA